MTRPDIPRPCQAERREAEARPPAPPPAPMAPCDLLAELAEILLAE